MGILENKSVQDKIVRLRGQDVILDFAVAEIYGVETREINQAVRNNPRKFPENYIINLDYQEFADLRSNFLIANSPKSRTLPKAFTEKGLYMLATISIIEAFAKLRELSRTIGELSACPDKYGQRSLMQRSGDIMADLFGEELQTNGTEIELNFAVMKLRHKVKRGGK
jgi:hypothetical protein